MMKLKALYGFYPIVGAGYGSFNNYIFYQEHGMEKFMKFPMFKKETEDEKYRYDQFRAVNFKTDSVGNLVCPNGKIIRFSYRQPIKGNLYGGQERCRDARTAMVVPMPDSAKGPARITQFN